MIRHNSTGRRSLCLKKIVEWECFSPQNFHLQNEQGLIKVKIKRKNALKMSVQLPSDNYLDKYVFVDDFSVQHFLREIAHQRVELVGVLRRRQTTKVTLTVTYALFTARKLMQCIDFYITSRSNATAITAVCVGCIRLSYRSMPQ